MNNISKLVKRPLVHVLWAIAVSSPQPARADWTYKTRITLLSDPSINVATKVKSALSIRGSVKSSANVRSLTKAFASEKAGFSIDGNTTVFFDSKISYLSQPVPNLSDTKHLGRRTELCDGGNIYTNDGQTGLVKPGKQLFGWAIPVGQILLGRFEPARKTITPREATSGAYEVKEYNGAVTPVRTRTNYSADGRTQSIVLYFADMSASKPIANYDVKSYDLKGVPTSIVITYFRGAGGPPDRKEEYTLIGSTAPGIKTPSDVFTIGETVIDERLGTAPADQASYPWTGTLPSLSTLRLTHKPLTIFTQNRTTARVFAGTAGLVLLAGTWLIVRKKTRGGTAPTLEKSR